MNKPELLAPAGTFECLEAALNHGADAVYAGVGTFNLRARSPNFSVDDLGSVIQFVHSRNRRIYLVLNTMPMDSQLNPIEHVVKRLSTNKFLPHAIILSDPGVLVICKKHLPTTPLHLSTQTGTFNRYAMEFWASQGIERVILPRELSLDNLRSLNTSGSCETEVFIHGAMCVSISGRCLLGAYIAQRHPNQGDCPQPCRYQYDIALTNTGGISQEGSFCAEEDNSGVYLLNSKDLNTLSILPEIIQSGVSSLKIEGRNKSVHYVSTVVNVYRKAIDRYCRQAETYAPEDTWFDDLNSVDHRPYTTGFYDGAYTMQEISLSKVQAKVRMVGMVKAIIKGGKAIVDVKNPFSVHEKLSLFPVSKNKEQSTIEFSELYDCNDNIIETAITNRLVVVAAEYKLAVGDILRKIV